MISVSIVDDEKRLSESIATFVNGTPGFRCVSTYSNAEAALQGLSADRPDVVLMDINMPGMSGIVCVEKLKTTAPEMQIVMLTVYEDIDQIFKALSAGASGYLLKRLSPSKLLQAIREVHAGGSPMSSSIARKVVASFCKAGPATEKQPHLSPREQAVLDLLAKGLTYKQIADHLDISIDTIRTYLRRIYEKLHVQSRTEAVAKYLRPERFKPMKSRTFLFLAVLLALHFGVPTTARAQSKSVMVYYMPWFIAKPYTNSWGWHWTMEHYNPDIFNAAGERQIASWYYPLIGPYDSADPVVLEYHVLLMKLAGIDGVIVDWYGKDNYLDYGGNNQRTAALFNFTRKAGLKFSLCYEDQTIQQKINGGYLAASNDIAHAQQTMLYVQTNYFSDGSFLKWSNQPVFLNFGPQYFKNNSQWQAIFSVLHPTNQPAFFTEDNRLPVGAGAFNWPPMWLSQAPGTRGVLSVVALENYLSGFDQKAEAWPAFISSAWPRFHDIYQPAGVRDYWGYLSDRSGDTFRETLRRAMTNASAIVQIVTWNDFGEGTVVEPTQEYGYRDLGIIQDFRRRYLEPDFAYHTNDLSLALRLYTLRRQCGANLMLATELDRAFTNIISGRLADANIQLGKAESELTNSAKLRDSRP